MYTGQYRLAKPGVMDSDPTFFITDEVGCAISHSDKPNLKMVPFIYSPNCEMDDSKTMTYSVLWLTEDVKAAHFFYRDFLLGITEKEWRSARFLPWFNVFEEYYQQEFEKFNKVEPPFDALKVHEEMQLNNPSPSAIDWDIAKDGPVPVYSDYGEVQTLLTDPRFKIEEDHTKAKIFWIMDDYATANYKAWNLDESKCFFSFFKGEEALVSKDKLALMVNTTLKDKSCIKETYDLNT